MLLRRTSSLISIKSELHLQFLVESYVVKYFRGKIIIIYLIKKKRVTQWSSTLPTCGLGHRLCKWLPHSWNTRGKSGRSLPGDWTPDASTTHRVTQAVSYSAILWYINWNSVYFMLDFSKTHSAPWKKLWKKVFHEVKWGFKPTPTHSPNVTGCIHWTINIFGNFRHIL